MKKTPIALAATGVSGQASEGGPPQRGQDGGHQHLPFGLMDPSTSSTPLQVKPRLHQAASCGRPAGVDDATFILSKSILNSIFNCRNAFDSNPMPPLRSRSWEEFIDSCAADVMAGRLTTQQLRRALRNADLRSHAAQADFRLSLVKVCEKLSPSVTKQRALMLEIDAADRRFRRLLELQSQPTLATPSVPLRLAN